MILGKFPILIILFGNAINKCKNEQMEQCNVSHVQKVVVAVSISNENLQLVHVYTCSEQNPMKGRFFMLRKILLDRLL